jgi:exopolyphosphatase/guanosine-5'-triphosphate,3'-diphosphate pyrophosphatase
LLVADVAEDAGGLTDLVRDKRITRLGAGVDRTGRFDPAAIERTIDVLREYAAAIERYGATQTRMAATSATRDAANRAVFVDAVRDILGVDPEVITGDEEARLSFAGATAGLPGDAEPPYLVVDIGGGSTEFVLGDEAVTAARSVDIGCVRLTERHLTADPPSPEQVAAAVADIDAAIALAAETVPIDEAGTLVGLAGSVTTVAGIALDLPAYDPAAIHRSRISRAQVAYVSAQLLAMTHEQRAAIPVMHPGRVDVIGAGALILDRVMERVGCPEVLVSEHDILDGLALSLVG